MLSPTRPGFAALLLAAALALPGCLLTDHSEQEAGITTTDMQIPASGYQGGDPSRLPVIAFDSTALDMGRMAEGVQVEKTYTFVNKGKLDLVITDVRASCGCTVAKNWPRMPIAPGAHGSITVGFNSQGRPGKQHKTITVVANTTPPTTVLTLSGEVVAPALH
ncbi:MAG: DUF1573 domain-containing protein [Flavobacteriales bacterium]|nr:DUF1573 domain-containing protein [Flavobacteriales bacterium]MBP9080522.1 DUF1573 domain-containing protein [Flavobacteriales bacterium]